MAVETKPIVVTASASGSNIVVPKYTSLDTVKSEIQALRTRFTHSDGVMKFDKDSNGNYVPIKDNDKNALLNLFDANYTLDLNDSNGTDVEITVVFNVLYKEEDLISFTCVSNASKNSYASEPSTGTYKAATMRSAYENSYSILMANINNVVARILFAIEQIALLGKRDEITPSRMKSYMDITSSSITISY